MYDSGDHFTAALVSADKGLSLLCLFRLTTLRLSVVMAEIFRFDIWPRRKGNENKMFGSGRNWKESLCFFKWQ